MALNLGWPSAVFCIYTFINCNGGGGVCGGGARPKLPYTHHLPDLGFHLSKTRYSWTKNAVTMAKTKAKEFLSRLTVSNLPPPGEREGESGAKGEE
jgi:hypothetical protein